MTLGSKVLATWGNTVAVLLFAGFALAGVDRLARAWAPLRDQTFATVAELEQEAGERLVLPAYFPSHLAWPPRQVHLHGGRTRTAVLTIAARSEVAAPRLYVAQAIGSGSLDREVLPGGVVLESGPVEVGGQPATLERIKGEDGAVWYGVSLRWRERDVVLRSRGGLEELLRMAGSLHREGR